MAGKYAVAFDLGTSSVKVAIVDDEANIVASDKRPLLPAYPKPGWAESDPNAWWEEGCALSRELIASSGIDPQSICGVSFDAPSAGATPVSREKGALYPSIIWLDFRAEEIVDEINDITAAATGDPDNRPWTGKDEIPKLCWMKRFLPDIWEEMDCFLADSGFMVYKATGELIMSKQDAFTYLYNWTEERWEEEVLAGVYQLEPRVFPQRVLNATEVAGYVTDQAAGELGVPAGLPVTAGYSDCSGAELGGGCVEVGDAALYVGTSMLFTAITDEAPEHSLASYTFPGVNPAHQMLLATNDMSGGCIDWMVERLFDPERYGYTLDECYKEVDRMLVETEPGAGGLFFTTSFAGERNPVMDNNVRAGFWNLGSEHGRPHMARAVYEGIAYQIRWTLEVFEEINGMHFDTLLMTGGGAKSPRLPQIIADVTGITLEIAEDPGFAVVKGTAFLSFLAAGVRDYRDAREQLRRVASRVVPNPANKAVYDRGMEFYKKYYATTKDFFKELHRG